MSLDPAIVTRIQLRLGLKPDGILGPITLAAIDAKLATLPSPTPNGFGAPATPPIGPVIVGAGPAISPEPSAPKILHGDGTWPFVAEIDGRDLILRNVYATAFGGAHDPQDNGETASGVNTKHGHFVGVSVAMDGRQFAHLTHAEHLALDGAPLPRIPWHTEVEAIINGKSYTFPDGILDLGPGKGAMHPGEPHGLDLTEPAAQLVDPHATSRNFKALCTLVRIKNAAQYARPT